MKLQRLVWTALGSTWRQRRRSGFASLGVAVGVACFVAMVAIGEGAEHEVLAKIRDMGTDLVIVTAGEVKTIAGRPRQIGNVTTLLPGDADAIAEECPAVQLAAPTQGTKLLLRHGDVAVPTTVLGSTAALLEVRGLALAQGRFFLDDEVRTAQRIVVLGATVAQGLFGSRSALGESVRVGGVPFEVVGVLTAKGTDASGQDQDDLAIVPLRTALRRLFNLDHINNIYVQARPGQAAVALEEMQGLLRERHRRAGKADDFTLLNQVDVLNAEKDSADAFTVLLAAVSAVALVIGGVGVLSVMLIAVRERVREVGLRRAVGATRRDILLQFLVEALAIGAAGGLLGLTVGVAVVLPLAGLAGWPVVVSWAGALRAIGVSLVVAGTFGAMPARRAAALDPATALRSA